MNLSEKVNDFWNEYNIIRKELEPALVNNDLITSAKLIDKINEKLITVANCNLEVSYVDEFFEIDFNPGFNKTSQYICSLLVKFKPKDLDNYSISAYLRPLSLTSESLKITDNGVEYTAKDFIVYYEIDAVNKNISIKVYCELFKNISVAEKEKYTYLMLNYFLGQLELELRITDIEIIDEPCDDENVCLMSSLYENVSDIVVDYDWPDYEDPTYIYYAYKLDKDCIEERVHKDIYLVHTSHPKLFEELNQSGKQIQEELKLLGGEYGYIYYEHTQEKEDIALYRQILEKEINNMVYDLKIARTIGGALGQKYAYINLIVFDRYLMMGAINKINEKLGTNLSYIAYR